MTYQPVWRDGALRPVGRVDRADSGDRYETVAKQLEPLGAFTALDLGAAEGYFTVRIAEDFRSYVTAVDDNPRLPELDCGPNGAVHVLNRRVTAGYLAAIPRDDVVLALSVLHHFQDWRAVLRWVVACREFALIEVPHPGERWMRVAAARHELREIHDTVAALPGAVRIAEHERVGRDGSRHARPMFRVPGTVRGLRGIVFAGSGSCSRKLPEFGNGLAARLGYVPFWGSLNLKLDSAAALGEPVVNWVGRNRSGRTRDYQFWDAWLAGNEVPVHVMVPGRRGHGRDCVELVSPVKLRDALGLAAGASVEVDVELGPEPVRRGGRRGR